MRLLAITSGFVLLLQGLNPQEVAGQLIQEAYADPLSSLHPTRIETGQKGLFALALSPDGKRVASVGESGDVEIWSIVETKRESTIRISGVSSLSLAFSPSSDQLATGWRDGLIRQWSVQTGKQVGELSGHHKPVTALAYDPSGRLLACGDAGGLLTVWEAQTGKKVSAWVAHNGSVASLAFAGDSLTIVSGAVCTTPFTASGVEAPVIEADKVRIWRANSGLLIRELPVRGARVVSSRNGRCLACSGLVHWIDPTGKRRGGGRIDGLTHGIEEQATVYDLVTDQVVLQFTGNGDCVLMTVDGSLLFHWSGGHTAYLLGKGTGNFFPPNESGRSLCLCSIYRPLMKNTVRTREVPQVVAVSDAGNRFGCGLSNGAIYLWTLSEIQKASTDRAHKGAGKPLESLLSDLGSNEPDLAFTACRELAALGDQVIPELDRLVANDCFPAFQRIPALCASLEDKSAAVRRTSADELAAMGSKAIPGLLTILEKEIGPESRRQLTQIIKTTQATPLSEAQRRQLRAVETYELIGSAKSQRAIEGLAKTTSFSPVAFEAQRSLGVLKRN